MARRHIERMHSEAPGDTWPVGRPARRGVRREPCGPTSMRRPGHPRRGTARPGRRRRSPNPPGATWKSRRRRARARRHGRAGRTRSRCPDTRKYSWAAVARRRRQEVRDGRGEGRHALSLHREACREQAVAGGGVRGLGAEQRPAVECAHDRHERCAGDRRWTCSLREPPEDEREGDGTDGEHTEAARAAGERSSRELLAGTGQRRPERLADTSERQAQRAKGRLEPEDQRRKRGDDPGRRSESSAEHENALCGPGRGNADSAELQQTRQRRPDPARDPGKAGQGTTEPVAVDVRVDVDRDVGRVVRPDTGIEVVEVGDHTDRDLLAREQRANALKEPGRSGATGRLMLCRLLRPRRSAASKRLRSGSTRTETDVASRPRWMFLRIWAPVFRVARSNARWIRRPRSRASATASAGSRTIVIRAEP